MSHTIGPGKKIIAGVAATATLFSSGTVAMTPPEPRLSPDQLRTYEDLVSRSCTTTLPSGAIMTIDVAALCKSQKELNTQIAAGGDPASISAARGNASAIRVTLRATDDVQTIASQVATLALELDRQRAAGADYRDLVRDLSKARAELAAALAYAKKDVGASAQDAADLQTMQPAAPETQVAKTQAKDAPNRVAWLESTLSRADKALAAAEKESAARAKADEALSALVADLYNEVGGGAPRAEHLALAKKMVSSGKSFAAVRAAIAKDLYLTKPAVIQAPSPNYDSRAGVDVDTIVLHHTASKSSASDLQAMRSASFDVSAHFLVDRDGTIYQLVDENKRAWHAGESQLHGVRTDVNSRSIGIEIVNDGRGQSFTSEQYAALNQLVPYLAAKFDVPSRNIVGHKEVAIPVGRKSDPAPNFDFDRVLAAVAESNRLQNVA